MASPSPSPFWKSPKYLGTALQLVFLTGLVLVGVFFKDKIPIHVWLRTAEQQVAAWGWPGLLVFPVIYGMCNVFLLPAGILSLGGGYFYGLGMGFVLVLAGNLFGALVAILMARWLLRGWIQRRFLAVPKYAALDQAVHREGAKLVFLTQLNPLFPTSLMNYFYGLTALPLGRCLLAIAAAGQTPGLLLYVYLGTLGHPSMDEFQQSAEGSRLHLWLWVGAAVVSVIITAVLGIISEKILLEALREKPRDGDDASSPQ